MAAKTFIVTGSSRGIGHHVAKRFLEDKHNVVLTARSANALEELAKEYPSQVAYLPGDMTESGFPQKLVDFAVKSFSQVDGLVVNHGDLQATTRVVNSDINEWKKLFDINFFSGIEVAKYAIPELRKTKGTILWVSSGASTSAYTSWGAYGSSKAAINQVSKVISAEEPDIVSVAFRPGVVQTDMADRIVKQCTEMDENQIQKFKDLAANKTAQDPVEVGATIARIVESPHPDFDGNFVQLTDNLVKPYRSKV